MRGLGGTLVAAPPAPSAPSRSGASFIPQSVEWARPLGEMEALPHGEKPARRSSAAQRAGLAYQRKVARLVVEGFSSWDVRIGPWFLYCDASGRRRYCQPDLLLRDGKSGTILLVEVKLRWTSDAWYQVRKLYQPVVELCHNPPLLFTLCICKSYDPAIVVPEEVALSDRLGAPLLRDKFNVLVLR